MIEADESQPHRIRGRGSKCSRQLREFRGRNRFCPLGSAEELAKRAVVIGIRERGKTALGGCIAGGGTIGGNCLSRAFCACGRMRVRVASTVATGRGTMKMVPEDAVPAGAKQGDAAE